MDREVRVLLDVNIFVGNIMAYDRGHTGSANQTLVSMLARHQWGMTDRAQLVISFEMIETLETVLLRQQFPAERVSGYCSSIIDIMKYGPDALDPYLILAGEERFAMSDAEDAGVLATAFGANADILVTDNLKDFMTKDADVIDTQVVVTASSGRRTLQALRYEAADLIVAHPFDVMHWLRLGYDFTPSRLWNSLQRSGKSSGL
ncbi:PIN domain-containing protein [Pararhizobium qamdonense]|uniref:PIN domain-containing protein n=1 Tax=Pararhizobium qamdonense TaxID=3031126 RepID=UPI0023E34CE1|nr:PIN domain-containing protein [Pararhizobium qamdonense]